MMLWKKLFLPMVLIAMAALLITGCRKQKDGAAEKITFTVGFDAEFPPYGYKTADGQYEGFDLDLAREVCKRNGWTFVPKPIAWDAKDMELNSGAINCIWNGFTINGRENAYEWSSPYVENQQVVLVLEKAPIRSFTDLDGKIVAAQTDTPVLKALSPNGERESLGKTFKKLVVTPSYNNAIMELESGSVDAIAMDIGVAKDKMNGAPGKFRMLDEIVMIEKYGIGFKKGNTELRDIVNNTLIEMVKDGSAAKISAKYFEGKDVLSIGKTAAEAKTGADTEVRDNRLSIKDMLVQILKGLLVSLAIFLLTLVISLPLGLLITFGRMSKNKILSFLFQIYISIMRGTPLMLQLFVWYFGPYYIFGIRLSDLDFCGIDYRFTAVIIGFSLNYAAYFAEIYRSGIESIPVGQHEAAYVLGYSKVQTFVRIILPQVVKRILPPMTNEFVTLVKDTSLAFSLSVLEMFTVAKQLSSAHTAMLPLIAAGIFYYVFNFIVASGMDYAERKLRYYK